MSRKKQQQQEDYRLDPDYKGEKTSTSYRRGPADERKCTDCFCLIVFGIFWAGLVMIGVYSYSTGNPAAIFAPYDQYNNACGLGNNTNFPYLYFVNDGNMFTVNDTLCVQTCPDNTNYTLVCAPDTQKCPAQAYSTVPIANRYCMPTRSNKIANLANTTALAFDTWMQISSDLSNGWPIIIFSALSALGIGFFYIFLMKHCTHIVTWGMITTLLLGLFIVGVIFNSTASGLNSGDIIAGSGITGWQPGVLQALAYVSWGLCGIGCIVLCFTYQRIKLAVAVLRCASDFVENVKTILLVPTLFFFLGLGFYILWSLGVVFIVGTNSPNVNVQVSPFAQVQWTTPSISMIIYYIFGVLWNHAYFGALTQFVIASAVCIWYFTQNNGKTKQSPVCTSLIRAFAHHIGSLAYGSFLVAVLDSFRISLMYFESHMRAANSGDSNNCFSNYCISCSKCCLGCFDKFLKFLNTHAYIQIAMTGKGFCAAAEDAFYLIFRNSARFGTVSGIGAVFVMIGELFITFAATAVGYGLTNLPEYANVLYGPNTVTFVCGVVSLMISHVFMSVYGCSADTIIQCYCMDEEMNGRAKNAPEIMKRFVDGNTDEKSEKLINN